MNTVSSLPHNQTGFVSPGAFKAVHLGDGQIDLRILPDAPVSDIPTQDRPIEIIGTLGPDYGKTPARWVQVRDAETSRDVYIWAGQVRAARVTGTATMVIENPQKRAIEVLTEAINTLVLTEDAIVAETVAVTRQAGHFSKLGLLKSFDWVDGPHIEFVTDIPMPPEKREHPDLALYAYGQLSSAYYAKTGHRP